jgi:cold shock CspA family protein
MQKAPSNGLIPPGVTGLSLANATATPFVHISAVERAGLGTLNEGQTVEYEPVTNRGKTSAEIRLVLDRDRA